MLPEFVGELPKGPALPDPEAKQVFGNEQAADQAK
jgi:hypothetical protein